MEDRNEILYARSYTLNSHPITMKAWTAKFNFHEEIMRVVPLWVRFPNLPLNYWGLETLKSIGSMIGVPMCTTRQMRVSFARLLIEVDVTKHVPRKIHIEDYNGDVIEQKVQYDWMPSFCQK